jgi:hypothetical protein
VDLRAHRFVGVWRLREVSVEGVEPAGTAQEAKKVRQELRDVANGSCQSALHWE